MTRPSLSTSFAPAGLPAAVALATIVLIFAFAVTGQAGARMHRTACVHSSGSHVAHGSHKCPAGRGGKGHAKSGKPRRHHSKRDIASGRHAANKGAGSDPGAVGANPGTGSNPGAMNAPGAGEEAAESSCADGTNAAVDGAGTFVCADGSEPSCAEGMAPMASNDGATLLCVPEEEGEEEEEG
jgi:hypothetical protein